MKTKKDVIKEALEKAKEQEKEKIESSDELVKEDKEFNQEGKRLNSMLRSRKKLK
jgi:hypothetical protein